MRQHEKCINQMDTLLVLNVQNQYKDIARARKKMKKILHYVRTDFARSPNLMANNKNILNKVKEVSKNVSAFDFKSQESSCCICQRQQTSCNLRVHLHHSRSSFRLFFKVCAATA